MNIQKLGLVGCGIMGSRIAQVVAQSGYDVLATDVKGELIDKGLGLIEGSLNREVQKGRIDRSEMDSVMGRLKGAEDLKDLRDRDIIIEAVTEHIGIKTEIFAKLDKVCSDKTIFVSNTSSLSITNLATTTRRPDKFMGLHFFNPAHIMELVEIVRTILTSDETFDSVVSFAKSLGKTPIVAKDNAGFIVNRLLVPYLLDAVRAFEEGLGSVEDIDRGMKLGCGLPIGPLALIDFIGLDTILRISDIMFDEYKEKRFSAPSILKQMVLAGYLGRKSGGGFYDYGEDEPVVSDFVRER